MEESVLSMRQGYLRLPEVLKLIPVGKSTWWKKVKKGIYPKGRKLGPNTTAWLVEDIEQLLKSIERSNQRESTEAEKIPAVHP
jgi:predicted DNA-binding transcriptional regulator AlpA